METIKSSGCFIYTILKIIILYILSTLLIVFNRSNLLLTGYSHLVDSLNMIYVIHRIKQLLQYQNMTYFAIVISNLYRFCSELTFYLLTAVIFVVILSIIDE